MKFSKKDIRRLVPSLVFVFGVLFLGVLGFYVGSHAKEKYSANADVKPLDASKLGVFGITNAKAGTDLGVKWTRIPLSWQKWELYKAGKGIDPQIKYLNEVYKSDLNVVITVQTQHKNKTKCNDPKAQGIASCPPLDLGEYQQYVKDVVNAYNGNNIYWQLSNEVYRSPEALKFWDGPFNDATQIDLIDTYQAGVEAIKSINSNVKIVAPGINFGAIDFSTTGEPQKNSDATEQKKWDYSEQNIKLFVQSQCKNTDYFDTHLYHSIESIPGRIKWLKNLLTSQNCNKPILATEIGGPNPKPGTTLYQDYLKDTAKFEVVQAQEVEQRMNKAIGSGVVGAMWFYYQDIGATGDAGNKLLGQFGLVDKSGQEKAAYGVMQQLAGMKSTVEKPTGGGSGSKDSDKKDDEGLGSKWGEFLPILYDILGGDDKPAGNTDPGTGGTTAQGGSTTGQGSTVDNSTTVALTPQKPDKKIVNNYGTGVVDFVPLGEAANVGEIVASIFKITLVISGAVFLVMFLFGAFRYLTGAGNEELTQGAKKTAINAIIGLLIVVCAYGVGVFILRALGFKI